MQPDAHAESLETKRRLHNLLAVSGLLGQLSAIKPRAATPREQQAFYTDPSVLTISIHQDRNYPRNSGALAEQEDGPW